MVEDFGKYEQIFHFIASHDDSRFKMLIKDLQHDDVRKIIHEKNNLSVLHWASLKGSFIIQNWLIDKMGFPADMDNNEYVWSPAHVTVIGGHEGCLEALLARNPNVINNPDRRGCTPLHLAAAHGRMRCMKKILKCTRVVPQVDKQCSKNAWTPLMYAAWHGRISCIELLIRYGAVTDLIDNEGRTPLHLAAAEGHLPLVKYFAENGCKDLLKCLSAVDNNGFTPKMAAEFNKKVDVVEFLVEKENDPRTWETTLDIGYPGHIAAINGELETLKNLVQKCYVSVNDFDDKGYTLLHKASASNQVHIVTWLLRAGASIYLKTLGNETALDIAKRRKYQEIIKILQREEDERELVKNKRESDRNIYIPILTSLDSSNPNFSFDNQRWMEQKTENETDLFNLTELMASAKIRLSSEESVLDSLKTDSANDHSKEILKLTKNIIKIKHEMLKLQHQIEVVKFNLYQLTNEPTEKEIEIGQALADCEYQFEVILDQLFFEREKREQLEAELSKTRIELLRLRDYILSNDVSNELLSMVISSDSFIVNKDNIPPLALNNIPLKEIRQYSLHFEVNERNKVTVKRLNYDSIPKEIENTPTKNITIQQFIKYIKLLLKDKHGKPKIKRKKRIRRNRKYPQSPVGGIFVTK